MSAFDKVIGYENIKKEMEQICDIIKNPDKYRKLGARLPHGALLQGAPGLGKTLMANCFIKESGLKAYTVRKSRSNEVFVDEITETFRLAKKNAPSIVFLDDMDKFASEESNLGNAESFVAVQSGIDEVRDSNVFVLATVNSIENFPDSLMRPGRFDRIITFEKPSEDESEKIFRHFLSKKKISKSVNIEDLVKMGTYNSCAKLETILNEAAINAAFRGMDRIETEDFVGAVLKTKYAGYDSDSASNAESAWTTALHEAGHLVVNEVLCPGCVGMASVHNDDGFVRRCRPLQNRRQSVITSLAGKAAVELYMSETCASGCMSDLNIAIEEIKVGICESGTCGLGYVSVVDFSLESETTKTQREAVIRSELEKNMFKAKDILLKNRDFLEKTARALFERKTLLYSDVQKIKSECQITSVAL